MPGFNVVLPECFESENSSKASGYIGPSNLEDTLRSQRFRATMRSFNGNYDIGLSLLKCSRPTPEIDEIVIYNGQEEIYRPGKHRWRPVEFTFYERLKYSGRNESEHRDIPVVNRYIFDLWSKEVLNFVNHGLRAPEILYKEVNLEMLSGDGNPAWSYKLYQSWPTKVTPSDLDYSASDICTTTVSMRFNKAVEN